MSYRDIRSIMSVTIQVDKIKSSKLLRTKLYKIILHRNYKFLVSLNCDKVYPT